MQAKFQTATDDAPIPLDEDKGPATVLEWAYANRNIDNHGFNLTDFAPLQHIYEHIHEDDHANVAIIKPAQRGVSELAVNYAVFALDRGANVWTHGAKIGLNVGYVFPTDDALGEFSKERFSGLRDETIQLAQLFKARGSFDAVGFKQVRQSYLYLRGAKSQSGLKSFPGDLLVLDEFDEIDTASVALVRVRLNASQVRRELDLSTPSIPGMGIHERWLQSDRNTYVQQCEYCDAWVTPRFYQDVWADNEPWDSWQYWTAQRIRMADIGVNCPNCRKPWSLRQRCEPGRWVAEQPAIKSLRGYWIPALCWRQANLTEMAVKAISSDPVDQTEFARSDLGEPYQSKDAQLTEDQILSLDAELPGGRLRGTHREITMGVDVGARFHYRVSGLAQDGRVDVLAMGSVATWSELSMILSGYGVRQCVVDALPETHACAEWQAKHRGKVLRAYYPNQVLGLFALKEDDNGVININRSRAMDNVQARIMNHIERWPTEICRAPEVLAHMTSPARIVGQDKHGQERVDWVHTRPDHYFHACWTPDTLVKTENGERSIATICQGERVWTRNGLRRVLASAMTNPDAEVWTYTFSNGAVLTGTPNHPILTGNRGWVPIHALVFDDTIITWLTLNQLPIEASSSVATRIVQGERTECITRQAVWSVLKGLSASTRKSGKTYTDLYRTGLQFIMSTMMQGTTTPVILSASLAASTNPTICESQGARRVKSIWTVLGQWLINGISQKLGDSGTGSTHRSLSSVIRDLLRVPSVVKSICGDWLVSQEVSVIAHENVETLPIRSSERARYAVKSFERIATDQPQHAQEYVGRNLSVRLSGRRLAGRSPVYNLSVDTDEEYFANGILAHNCVYDVVAREALPPAAHGVLLLGSARTQLAMK
jgi:hypothetical protein